jgi:hypothetical protein
MAIWWLDPYIEAAVGGIHGTTDTTTRNGSYAAPFAFSNVVGTSNNGATSINGQSIANGDELRLKGLDYQSFLYNTSTTDNKLNVTYQNTYRFNVVSSEHQTQWDNWLTAHDNMNYNHGVVMYYDPNLIGTHKWLFQNIDIDASNSLIGESIGSDPGLANAWHEGLQKSTGAWQISMFNPDYIIDRASTASTEYYFREKQYNVTITDGWTSETVRDGVTFIVDENSNYSGTKYWFTPDRATNSSRDPYYKIDLPDTFIYMYNANSESNSHRPELHFNHIPAGETWRLGKFACPSASAWKYLYVRGNESNNQLTDTDRDTRKLEIGTLQLCAYLQAHPYIGTTTIYNLIMYRGPMVQSSTSHHNRLVLGHIALYTQYTENAMIYTTTRGAAGGYIKLFDGALLSAVASCSYLMRPGYDAALVPSDNPETILTSASASWPYPLGDAGNSSHTLPLSSGLTLADTKIYGAGIGLSAPIPVLATPTTFMSTKTLGTTAVTNVSEPTVSMSSVFPELEFSGDYRDLNVNITVNDFLSQQSGTFHQTNITFARNSYDGVPMTLALPTGTYVKNALICYNDSQNNNKLCIQGASFAGGGFYYKNFLQELPSEVSAGDVTGVTMTVKATDIVYTHDLTSLCYYVNTAGNNSYFYLSWTQTSDADGYKTFNGTNNMAVNGLSADYPFFWIMFGVVNNTSVGKNRKYWIEDITFETA